MSGTCATPEDFLAGWTFTYDGDGSRVKQVYTDGTSTLTTYYFFGGAYEVQSDGTTETVLKYYTLAGMTIAVDAGYGLEYFLTDHLGSIAAVTDDSGALLSEQRYLPFGQVRTDVGTITQTDYGYTGQRNLDAQQNAYSLGLMDYKARFYSPLLGRFVQPDTIVPGAGNPQAFNRYSYANNNPIIFIDPTGHIACIDGEICGKLVITTKILKSAILGNFGVTMSDEKSNWNRTGLETVFFSLQQINSKINGKLGNTIGGSTFYYNGIEKGYSGRTNPNDITFNVKSGNPPPVHLVYHEVGHLLNFKVGNYFTNALASKPIKLNDGSYLMGGPEPYNRNSNGYANPNVDDPFWGIWGSEAELGFLDGSYNSANEEWADLFANYMSGNFNQIANRDAGAGIKRISWVTNVLSVQFGD